MDPHVDEAPHLHEGCQARSCRSPLSLPDVLPSALFLPQVPIPHGLLWSRQGHVRGPRADCLSVPRCQSLLFLNHVRLSS